MLGVGQNIFDIFYPIGTYYETSDTNFNPNTAHSWYGTWVEDTAGRVLVAQDTTQTEFDVIGETGGNKSISWTYPIGWTSDGRLSLNQSVMSGSKSEKNTWTRRTTAQEYATGMIGNNMTELRKSESRSVLQPYIVIKRWHRIA